MTKPNAAKKTSLKPPELQALEVVTGTATELAHKMAHGCRNCIETTLKAMVLMRKEMANQGRLDAETKNELLLLELVAIEMILHMPQMPLLTHDDEEPPLDVSSFPSVRRYIK